MRLIERQYSFLDLANWVVPLAWVYLARRLGLHASVVFAGLAAAFALVNYRLASSDSAPAPKPAPRFRIYFAPGFWFALGLAVYLGYLMVQSPALLGTVLACGTLGAVVAAFLRWRHRASS
jgi:uncharacterized membrane protein YczE